MKRFLYIIVILGLIFLTSCSPGGFSTSNGNEVVRIVKLTISYVTDEGEEELAEKASLMGKYLIPAFEDKGYRIGEIAIIGCENDEDCIDLLNEGEADIALVKGESYALNRDDITLALAGTTRGLNNDSIDPTDWNGDDNRTERLTSENAPYHRSLIYATPSDRGKVISDKVMDYEDPLIGELASCIWAVGPRDDLESYLFPSLWLNENYGIDLSGLPIYTEMKEEEAMIQAASGSVDIIVGEADLRNRYEKKWTGEWGREDSIWNELSVIGISSPIYNDAIIISQRGDKENILKSERFIDALKEVFMGISESSEGEEILSIYGYTGFMPVNPDDYEPIEKACLLAGEGK